MWKKTNKQRPRNRIDELDRCVLQQASSFLSCWRFLNFKKREKKTSCGGRCVWAHGCNKCSFIWKMAEVFPLGMVPLIYLTPTACSLWFLQQLQHKSHESQPARSPRSDGREASRTSEKKDQRFPPMFTTYWGHFKVFNLQIVVSKMSKLQKMIPENRKTSSLGRS